MPEIGEVARIVNRLRKHVAGKIISSVATVEDTIVYSGTTHTEFRKAMAGKKVVDAKQWGKYFWLVMESPPHPVMHFGMTGWIQIKNDPSAQYRSMTIESKKRISTKTKSKAEPEVEEDVQPEAAEWPPRFWKFNFKFEGDNNEIAFTDVRRIGRIRLINEKDGSNIRNLPPISANGPDPVQEPVTEEWLSKRLRGKKISVKAFLLDQTMLAGVGNWVADEILYDARIHPETYTNTLSDEQIKMFHKSLLYVTKTVVDIEGENSKLPEGWLMLHRWNKGKNNDGGAGKLPNGEKIEFLKVGGRTSAFVPKLQKKGALDKGDGGEKSGRKKVEVKEGAEKGDEKEAAKKGGRKKAVKEESRPAVEEEEEEVVEEKPKKRTRTKKVGKNPKTSDDDTDNKKPKPAPIKRKAEPKSAAKEEEKEGGDPTGEEETPAPKKTKIAARSKKEVKASVPREGTRRSNRIRG